MRWMSLPTLENQLIGEVTQNGVHVGQPFFGMLCPVYIAAAWTV
jgi:hypothetical protein